jgi:hypothetical protein
MKADNESRKAEQIDEPNSEQKRLAEIEARPKQPPIEPIGPVDPMDLDKSLKMFLRDQTDVKESTVEEYDDDLDWFREFCEKNDIEITTEVTSQIIKKYRHWRKYESSNRVDQLATKTMRDEMFLIRNYIRF